MAKLTREQQSKQRQAHWQTHVTAWQQSGQTRAAYCEQHGLSLQTFAYWRKRLKTKSSPVKLVQISTELSRRQPKQPALRLTVDDRFAIEVCDGFTLSTLARVIEVVRSL